MHDVHGNAMLLTYIHVCSPLLLVFLMANEIILVDICCCSWTSSSPHTVGSFITDVMMPDGSKAAAGNGCHSTQDTDGAPWCYTTNAGINWMYCNIPYCTGRYQVSFAILPIQTLSGSTATSAAV